MDDMGSKAVTTRYDLSSGHADAGVGSPCFWIYWTPSEFWAGGGYDGVLTLWHTPNDKDEHTHTVSIGQGLPLGEISLIFDGAASGYGCWSMASFPGVGVTHRDLQWATIWAAECLKSRRELGDLRKIEKKI